MRNLIALLTVFAAFAACSGGHNEVPTVARLSTQSISSPSPGATAPAAIVGAEDGTTCVPRGNGETLYPDEDLCITFPSQTGSWSAAFSPSAPWEPINPMITPNTGKTIQIHFRHVAGTSYTVTLPSIVLSPGVQWGGHYSFTVNVATTAQLAAAQATPVAHETGYFGAEEHAAGVPFGMYHAFTPPYPIDTAKFSLYQSQGIQVGRVEISPYFANPKYGTYDFSVVDPLLTAMQNAGQHPYVEIDAGPVVKSQWAWNSTDQYPVYPNWYNYGQFCTAVAQHLHANYPSVSKLSITVNEPNLPGGWQNELGAQNSGNPLWNSNMGAGDSFYMQPCYAAIKAVSPAYQVFAAELGFQQDSPTSADAPTFVSNMYQYGCRVGTCFDGLSMHLSPFNGTIYPQSACFAWSAGWMNRCYKDIQAIAVAHGDPVPPVILSETGYSTANISQGYDEPGQAYMMAEEFATLEKDPSVVGVYWSYIDGDGTTHGSLFGEMTTVEDDQVTPKQSFAIYKAFAGY